MCRFAAYIGNPIIIDELLVKPTNSLINQSYDAEEMSQPLNGDGFGLGWYVREIRRNPGLFRSITPAWNNQNLAYNASLIQTNCLFAHVRAASVGGITEFNCHPFHFEQYLMMHNGGIEQFPAIKRGLINALSDEFFLWIKGQTDSEHIFALLMQFLRQSRDEHGRPLRPEEVSDCFSRTFETIEKLKSQAGISSALSTLNMMITDGDRIFGTRYSSDPDKITPTLYFSTGSKYVCEDGKSRMLQTGEPGQKAVLIVSEKLSDNPEDWTPIPANHFIAVERNLDVVLSAMN